jgi:hypothetical protein
MLAYIVALVHIATASQAQNGRVRTNFCRRIEVLPFGNRLIKIVSTSLEQRAFQHHYCGVLAGRVIQQAH